jgi:hypothetical protein
MNSLSQFESKSSTLGRLLWLVLHPVTAATALKIYRDHPDEEISLRLLLLIHMNDLIEPMLSMIVPITGDPAVRVQAAPFLDLSSILYSYRELLFQEVRSNFFKAVARSSHSQYRLKSNSQPISPLMQYLQPSKVSPATSFPSKLFIADQKSHANEASHVPAPSRFLLFDESATTGAAAVDMPLNTRANEREIYGYQDMIPSLDTSPIRQQPFGEQSSATGASHNNNTSSNSIGIAPTIHSPSNASKYSGAPGGSLSSSTESLSPNDLVWIIPIQDSRRLYQSLRKSVANQDDTKHASISTIPRLFDDHTSSTRRFSNWEFLHQIQASYVGQIYKGLHKIAQLWISSANESSSTTPATSSQIWEDAIRYLIMQTSTTNIDNIGGRRPPFSARRFDEPSCEEESSSQLFSLLESFQSSQGLVSQYSIYACLIKEAIHQLQGLFHDLADEIIELDDSWAGIIDILTQFMHMAGVILGFAFVSGVVVNIDLPDPILDILSNDAKAVSLADEDPKQLLLRSCGLCLRHGLAAILPENVLMLWSKEYWRRRLSGWTTLAGCCSGSSLEEYAVYAEGVDPSQIHIRHFWSCVHQLSSRQLTALVLALWDGDVGGDAAAVQIQITSPSYDFSITESRDHDGDDIELISSSSSSSSTKSLLIPRYPSIYLLSRKLYQFLASIVEEES